jgi:lipoprotein-anchoring transpeptidase ErfK/SrfK
MTVVSRVSRRRRPALLALLIVVCVAALGGGGVIVASRATVARAAVKSTPTAMATATLPPVTSGPLTYTRLKCDVPSQPSVMMTPRQLADPYEVGYEAHAYDNRVECVVKGLYVPTPHAGVPHAGGKVILVSLSQQWLWAYVDGKLAFANPVTTGQRWLPTPRGTFSVSEKVRDTTFYSPWGPGSPYYYAPEHVNYALYFRDKGYYLHDAPWRHAFGPGTNAPHTSPDGAREDGSHGCVNMTTAAARWLYDWAGIGTTVIVTN